RLDAAEGISSRDDAQGCPGAGGVNSANDAIQILIEAVILGGGCCDQAYWSVFGEPGNAARSHLSRHISERNHERKKLVGFAATIQIKCRSKRIGHRA